MRIAILTRNYPTDVWGGDAVLYYNLARGLVRAGHEVHVICQAETGEHEEENDGVFVHRVGTDARRFSPTSRVKYNFECWLALRTLMMNQVVDVVEVADWGAEGLLPALSKRAALVVTAMGATDHLAVSSTLSQRAQYALLGWGAGWSVRLADRVIAISEDSQRAVLERFRADPRKVTKVSLGIDLDIFRRVSASPDKAMQGLPRGRIVSYVGLITHRHGVVSLCRAVVKAMHVVQELYLVIVGRDASTAPGRRSMKAFLREIASSEGFADRFVFIDSLSLPNLIQLYSASDVFVYPHLAGTFGLPVIEAMACGVPVVTTRVAVGRELEHYGLDGLAVVPVEDDGEIAASIIRFLGLSHEIRRRIGQENRRLIESRFSISSWVHDVGTVYVDAVRERNSHVRT